MDETKLIDARQGKYNLELNKPSVDGYSTGWVDGMQYGAKNGIRDVWSTAEIFINIFHFRTFS